VLGHSAEANTHVRAAEYGKREETIAGERSKSETKYKVSGTRLTTGKSSSVFARVSMVRRMMLVVGSYSETAIGSNER
jgi:hypothetical protein